jgi:hypothetical protein
MRTGAVARVVIGVLAVGGMAAAGCGDDGGSAATTTTTASTSTTAETSTTAPDATTTTGEATTTTPADEGDGPAIPTNAEDYAVAFVDAWEHGDHDTALVLGTQEAVDTLFALESGGPGTWTLDHCEGAAGSSFCTFTAGGDPTVLVRVANEAASQGAPQAVIEVRTESP